MKDNVISVIIPVHNGELWIKRCINSLLNQNDKNKHPLEIIIVDDGSTDRTSNIIDTYQLNYDEVRVIHTENRGVSEARNTGLELSTGEYITFIDVDDYVETDYFEKLMGGVKQDIDIICGGFKVDYAGTVITKSYPETQIEGCENILRAYFAGELLNINVWGKIYKASTAKKVLFNSRYKVGEDKLYLFECFLLSRKIIISNTCGYHYFVNQSSVMREEFTKKKLDGLFASEEICHRAVDNFPSLRNEAESWLIDVKCRACDELLSVRYSDKYKEIFDDLINDIQNFSIIKKVKYSSKKHFIVFLIMRICPRLYSYLKRNTKLQYK